MDVSSAPTTVNLVHFFGFAQEANCAPLMGDSGYVSFIVVLFEGMKKLLFTLLFMEPET